METLNIAQNNFGDIEALGELKNLRYLVFDANSWHLQAPKVPQWLNTEKWSYREEMINYIDFVYFCERIQ